MLFVNAVQKLSVTNLKYARIILVYLFCMSYFSISLTNVHVDVNNVHELFI